MKLEVDHFALIGRQLFQGGLNPGKRLTRVVPFVEIAGDRDLLVFDGRHARRLPPRIEREVAAHREQPRSQTPFELRWILPAQAQKGFLHDVPGGLHIAEEPFRVADQRPLVTLQRTDYPGGLRHPAHSVPMVDNDAAAGLLDGA